MVIENEVKKINDAIGNLVYDKVAMRKAYGYYHCHRDADQFKHLEENYGIGTPTSVSFTPLIKKHIDVLVGEYLGLNQDLKVSCKDEKTVSNIMREKQLKISAEVFNYLQQYLKNNIIAAIIENKEIVNDPFVEKEIASIQQDIDQSFVSEYEIAAQNILDYLRQSRNIDLKRKMAELLTDLLITGTCYYRVKPTESNSNVNIEILNPVNTFIERNPNSPYLADSKRVVIRKWMSREDILNTFRSELTTEAAKKIRDMQQTADSTSPTYLVRYVGKPAEPNLRADNLHTGILAGLEAHPGWPGDYDSIEPIKNHLIPVYEVEWIEADYKTGELTRHEGVKIGSEVYITRGESKYIVRSADCPSRCRLSVNGIFFLDKNGDPYSLVTNTMDLQDKLDLLIYCRDNLIASSGGVGDWMDVSFIPSFLGDDLTDRVKSWQAYKKNGLALINSKEEGSEGMPNTIFNGFDDTVKAQAIQGIQLAIQAVEQQASSITGVLPERLAQYEQRDAVSNVQLGVKMSGLLTKQYFETMDIIYKEANYDMLNLAKLVYPNGITGTIVLGNKYSRIFTALPEHYTLTDFDLHIEDSSKSFKDMETVKALNIELIKAGMSDPDMAVSIATANSMSELKRYVAKATAVKKEENNSVSQLQQQLQQYEQNLQQLQKQNEQLQRELGQSQNQLEQNSQARLQLEAEKVAIEREKVKNDKDYNDKLIETKQQQVQIQAAETVDTNPYNDKIKQVV